MKRSPSCGGFFDVASLKKRMGELDSLMAADSFWNNREQAQKLIDEAAGIRKRMDPLLDGPGWYAISVNHLRQDFRMGDPRYAPFLHRPVTSRAGYSIYIYQIP